MFEFRRCGLLFVLLIAAFLALPQANAKDGDSGGGNSGSGSGSENSGPGGGDDNDNDDDNDTNNDDDNDTNNDDDNDDKVESDGRNDSRSSHSRDHDRVLRALQKGKVVSLQLLRRHLDSNYPGKLLRVDLKRKSGTYYYNVRILAPGNRIRAVSLNALTLKVGDD
jgi:uncharacterized membrane protein YkoI